MHELQWQHPGVWEQGEVCTIQRGSLGAGDAGYGMHWHENLELIYAMAGGGFVSLDFDTIPLAAGGAVVVGSNMPHSVAPAKRDFEYLCMVISKDCCEQCGIHSEDVAFVSAPGDEVLGAAIRAIRAELEHRDACYHEMVRAEVMRMLIYLSRQYGRAHPQLDDSAHRQVAIVRQALGYIRKHFREQLTIDRICRSVGVSKYYLCHTFKQVTGKTMVAHMNSIRCHHARMLLLSGECNVLEALQKSGFQDPSYFSQVYKRQMGVSPSAELRQERLPAAGK